MKDEIRESLKAIVTPVENKGSDLVEALRTLDAIVSNHSRDLHPQMRHFLQNRSYEKALLWLDGGEPVKGICQK